MHTDACYVPRAQDSQERYRVLFVPVANARAIHSVNSHGRDRALGKWKEFFCIESSIETCAPYDVLISICSISFLTSFYEFEFFKSYPIINKY